MALRVWFVIALILPALIALQIVLAIPQPKPHCSAGYRPGVVTELGVGEVVACVDTFNPRLYLPDTVIPPLWKRLVDATLLNPFIYGLIALHLVIALIIYTPISIFWLFIGFPLATMRAYYSAIAAWDEFGARRAMIGRRLFPGKTTSTQEFQSESNNLGSAFFVPESAAAVLREAALRQSGTTAALGLFGDGSLSWATDKHVLVLASSRSGKGVSLIIPNLLTYPGGVFVLDPKGENARATLRQRATFGPVAVLDPWDVARLPAASQAARRGFNPLAALLDDPEQMPTAAAALAGALVIGQDDHWNNAARLLLRGVLLHVLTAPRYEGRRDLVSMRGLLMGTAPADLFAAMRANPAAGGLVQQCGEGFASTPDVELGSIVSAARVQTMFLDDPALQNTLREQGDGIDFGQWRDDVPLSVFVCLPAPYMQTFSRWLRLVVTAALNSLTTRQHRLQRAVQFHLDELATLGRLEAVETAIGLAAGYGVQVWSVFQDLGQIRDLYRARAPSFWSNAGIRAVFNLQDVETAEYVSRLVGTTTVQVYSAQRSAIGLIGGGTSAATARPLVLPDEVMMRYARNTMLVLLDGISPIEARRVPYYENPNLRGLWDDPR